MDDWTGSLPRHGAAHPIRYVRMSRSGIWHLAKMLLAHSRIVMQKE